MATSAERRVAPQLVPELEPKIEPILEPIVAASAPTVSSHPSHPAPLPLNWDDVDPISLEPVCTLWPYFEMAQACKQADSQELSQELYQGYRQMDERGDNQLDEQGDEQANQQAAKSRSEPAYSKNKEPRVRRYDAWAWLEMLRRDKTGQYKHPVTGERIDVKDRAACVKACMQACREAHLLQQSVQSAQQSVQHVQQSAQHVQQMAHLLEPCGTSLNVERAIERDPVSGELVRVQFYAVDPSLEVILTAAWARPTVGRLHNTESASDTETNLDNEHPPTWAYAVNSKVATQYDIRDSAGRVVAHRTVWFG